MSIRVIDPNEANNSRRNGIPDYSRMFIFVELLASRRESTVLQKRSFVKEGSVEKVFDSLTVSMLGYDPNINKFTTRYSDVDSSVGPKYEGFGITDIEITINSSYVPQVEIEFTDNRGLSLFNLGKNSPYAALHSFPPPLFQLTVKGFYGGQLTYDLHLVKQHTRFDTNTGNYVVSATFIGRTYAPLTDVLFKYVEIAPYMGLLGPDSAAGLTNNDVTTPTNTLREFILKSKKLYERLGDFIAKSEESKNKQLKLNKATGLKSVYNDIDGFPETFRNRNVIDSRLNNSGYLIIKDNLITSNTIVEFQEVTKELEKYVDILRTDATAPSNDTKPEIKKSKNKSLYAAFKLNEDTALTAYAIKGLEDIRKDILSKIKVGGYMNVALSDDDIPNKIVQLRFNDEDYVGLDISILINKIWVQYNEFQKQVDVANKDINDKIKTTVQSQLDQFKQKTSDSTTDGEDGFIPTIGNVFRLICNDVDKFFDIMRNTSKEAETHHQQFKSNIFNELSRTLKTDVKKIYPFPTYTKLDGKQDKITRAYPSSTEFKAVPEFPEARMVEDFVNAFVSLKKQEKFLDLRTKEDTSGNKKWIPISPVDSVIVNEVDTNSPYFGLKNDPGIDAFFTLLHDRFISYSQYFYSSSFYQKKSLWGLFNSRNDADVKYDVIRQLVNDAETINIVNSLDNKIVISRVKELSAGFAKDPNSFYKYLTDKGITVTDKNKIVINGNSLYKDTTNSSVDNESIKLIDAANIGERISTGDSTDPIEVFLDTNKGFLEIFEKKNKVKKFTSDNVVLYSDTVDGSKYETGYLLPVSSELTQFNPEKNSILDRYTLLYTLHDSSINNMLNDGTYDRYVKGFFVASNYTQNVISDNTYWSLPSLLELPQYVILFLGGYVYHYFSNDDTRITTSDEFFQKFFDSTEETRDNDGFIRSLNALDVSTHSGPTYNIDNVFTVGNISRSNEHKFILDLLKSLTPSDRTVLLGKFVQFVGDGSAQSEYDIAVNNFQTAINQNINKSYKNGEGDDPETQLFKSDKYLGYINSFDTHFQENVLDPIIMKNTGLAIFGENMINQNNPKTYQTLTEINVDSNKKEINDTFFTTFFKKLNDQLIAVEKNNISEELKTESRVGDNDIKSQCYYSFKSIYDKWFAGGLYNDNGYILANKAKTTSLFDSFFFVDRAFNDISQKCIIDFKPLIDASTDYDVSVFTVISQLLAHNNFEFFPLQNFMAFKDGAWEQIFETVDKLDLEQRPAFICMYVGGTSSQLNDPDSDYKSDGFDMVDGDFPTDFNSNNANENSVRAFKVRYGTQNQSFFRDVSVDTIEHKDTNESLTILSKLASDDSQSSPIPKGQNLFNTYETRSYSCTVQMMGDVMIQPTQYFQLEGIPMFSGAYLILEVKHKIRPNSMETIFKGVRVLKYPVPIVTDIAAIAGLIGGQSSITQDITGAKSLTQSTTSNRVNRTNKKTVGSDYTPNPSAIDPIAPTDLLKMSPDGI